MKLVCLIGTQGLPDGRRISRGDVYEVDDETASTLITARYAKEYAEPTIVDDAITHVDQGVDVPTSTSTASEIKRYLDDAGIEYGIRMSKSELLELVNSRR